MRSNGVNKVGYKIKKEIINSSNINIFEKLSNRRDLRKSTVNKLYGLLEKGKHFETPVMVNIRKDKHRLIDGNHRIEAIEKYIEKFPERKVELYIAYYEDLNDKEEKQEYTRWNQGTKQTMNDFIKQHWDDIPIIAMMEKDFPYKISHCWTSKAMEFRTLINAYLSKENKYDGQISLSAPAFIDRCKLLGKKDHTVIKAFMKEYIQIFGIPNKKNPHYKVPIFLGLFRIWLDNINKIGYEKMNKAMIKVRSHYLVMEFSKRSQREDCKLFRQKILEEVFNRRSNKFL